MSPTGQQELYVWQPVPQGYRPEFRFHGTDLVGEVQSYRESCIRPKKTTAPHLIVIMVPPTSSKVALQLYT